MHKRKDLNCKVATCYDETFEYLEIFFFWNRINLFGPELFTFGWDIIDNDN